MCIDMRRHTYQSSIINATHQQITTPIKREHPQCNDSTTAWQIIIAARGQHNHSSNNETALPQRHIPAQHNTTCHGNNTTQHPHTPNETINHATSQQPMRAQRMHAHNQCSIVERHTIANQQPQHTNAMQSTPSHTTSIYKQSTRKRSSHRIITSPIPNHGSRTTSATKQHINRWAGYRTNSQHHAWHNTQHRCT